MVTCYHSYETYLVELLRSTIYFIWVYRKKFRVFSEFSFRFLLGVRGVRGLEVELFQSKFYTHA